MQPIHFLHLGKTGGIAIKHALEPIADQYGIVLHGHGFTLRDVPEGDRVIFSIRSPLTRFVSGFNSRFRRGQPRGFSPWQFGEQDAFVRFPEPNALAEALWTEDDALQAAARRAMLTIEHVRSSYSDWLWCLPYVEVRRPSVLFIAAQESLSADFDHLRHKLGLPVDVALPQDPIDAHRTPEGFATSLSETARRNLERWYAKDIAFHTYLQEIRLSIMEG